MEFSLENLCLDIGTQSTNREGFDYNYFSSLMKIVTKISSCRVNTTSWRGIKQLRVSFGFIFLLFPLKVVGDHVHSSRGKSPAPVS